MNKKLLGGLAVVEVLAFMLLEGSMATLGIMVAPMLFKTIASRDLAGRVFGNILGVWLWFGLIGAALLVITAAVTLIQLKFSRQLLLLRLALPIVMLGLVIAFGFVLGRMNSLQASLTKPLDDYPVDVNPRLEIDQLHKLSTNLLSGMLVLGLIWFGLSIFVLFRLNNAAGKVKSKALSGAEDKPLTVSLN